MVQVLARYHFDPLTTLWLVEPLTLDRYISQYLSSLSTVESRFHIYFILDLLTITKVMDDSRNNSLLILGETVTDSHSLSHDYAPYIRDFALLKPECHLYFKPSPTHTEVWKQFS